ncbi:MAG: ABC transporter permease [Acidimicrobiaceae bacterium]|nr:ABC transporter permease [Acidimicrobiaceae bacterium]MYE09064.1 ABC transporter permease [Acidimicrobiaceae bacterium]MYI34931.1 ABC transporter permease [Acidimicrobiaceae bacterium]
MDAASADTGAVELRRLLRALRSEAWLGRLLVIVSAVVLIVVWHFWARTNSPLILPEPGPVLERLLDYVGSGRANPHIWITVQEIILGFALGGIAGIGLGTLASEFGIARRVIMPYVIVTQALPKFALAPILVIWFGFGMTPKVIIAALIAFFPLLENTYLGLTTAPAEMLELFRALRAGRWTTLTKCKALHAVPAVFSGLRVALMLALVGAVVAEYVGANKGLGALIIVSQGTLDTELMFVAFVQLTVLGLLLDQAHGLVYRLVMRRLYGSVGAEMRAAGVSV